MQLEAIVQRITKDPASASTVSDASRRTSGPSSTAPSTSEGDGAAPASLFATSLTIASSIERNCAQADRQSAAQAKPAQLRMPAGLERTDEVMR